MLQVYKLLHKQPLEQPCGRNGANGEHWRWGSRIILKQKKNYFTLSLDVRKFICGHSATAKSSKLPPIETHIGNSKKTFHILLWDTWKSQCVYKNFEVRHNDRNNEDNGLDKLCIDELYKHFLENILEEGLVSPLPTFQWEILKDGKI